MPNIWFSYHDSRFPPKMSQFAFDVSKSSTDCKSTWHNSFRSIMVIILINIPSFSFDSFSFIRVVWLMVYCETSESSWLFCVYNCSRISNICDVAIISYNHSYTSTWTCLNNRFLIMSNMQKIRLTIFESLINRFSRFMRKIDIWYNKLVKVVSEIIWAFRPSMSIE